MLALGTLALVPAAIPPSAARRHSRQRPLNPVCDPLVAGGVDFVLGYVYCMWMPTIRKRAKEVEKAHKKREALGQDERHNVFIRNDLWGAVELHKKHTGKSYKEIINEAIFHFLLQDKIEKEYAEKDVKMWETVFDPTTKRTRLIREE